VCVHSLFLHWIVIATAGRSVNSWEEERRSGERGTGKQGREERTI